MSENILPQADPRAAEKALNIEAQIAALRRELESLEARTEEVKAMLQSFSKRQAHELGPLADRLFDLKIAHLEKLVAEAPTPDNELQLLMMKQLRDGFMSSLQEPVEDESFDLQANEAQELKTLFHKALRLCHPDLVPKEEQEKAAAICRMLTEAYKRNDLLVVQDILLQLESKTERPMELQDRQLDVLKKRISRARGQLKALEEGEAYTTASQIDDWDAYFAEARANLQSQIDEILQET